MKEKLNNEGLVIIISYIFNIFFILLGFAMMKQYVDGLIIVYLIVGSLFLFFWILTYLKSYVPWKVFGHFCIGAVVQILLNYFGIIPEDDGWFAGLGQAVYIFFLFIQIVLMAFINLIKFIIFRYKTYKAVKEEES